MPMQPAHAAELAASPWVARFAPLVPAGDVLDLACGRGRHALLFAQRGHAVLAVDRDPVALDALAAAAAQRQLAITVRQHDLERDPASGQSRASWPFEAGRFAAIVVTNYLYRPLLPSMAASLMPGGVLLYETFAIGNERFGKPSNPDFLLRPGELLAVATAADPSLRVIAFEDGYRALPAPAMVQRLCARRPVVADMPEILPGI